MSTPRFLRTWAPWLGLLAACAVATAGEPTSTETEQVAEAARGSARAVAVWLARGVDSWFGDRPFEDGGTVSDGRLSTALLARQGDPTRFDLRFNARFRLPNLEDKTYAYVGRDDPRDLVTDRPGAFSRQGRLFFDEMGDRAFFAGVGRPLGDAVDLRLGVRGCLEPFAQLRYRQAWQLGADSLVDGRQTLFWTPDDRVGSTTAVSWEHALSPRAAARWLHSATITGASPRFEWSSLMGGYRSFGDQRLLGLEAVVTGRQGWGLTDHGVQARWEQPLGQDWLLGGLLLGRFWPREDALAEARGAWALGASLKMRF